MSACSVFPHGMATALYGFSIRVDSTHASDAERSVIQRGSAKQLWRMRALAVPHFTGKASAGMPNRGSLWLGFGQWREAFAYGCAYHV